MNVRTTRTKTKIQSPPIQHFEPIRTGRSKARHRASLNANINTASLAVIAAVCLGFGAWFASTVITAKIDAARSHRLAPNAPEQDATTDADRRASEAWDDVRRRSDEQWQQRGDEFRQSVDDFSDEADRQDDELQRLLDGDN